MIAMTYIDLQNSRQAQHPLHISQLHVLHTTLISMCRLSGHASLILVTALRGSVMSNSPNLCTKHLNVPKHWLCMADVIDHLPSSTRPQFGQWSQVTWYQTFLVGKDQAFAAGHRPVTFIACSLWCTACSFIKHRAHKSSYTESNHTSCFLV